MTRPGPKPIPAETRFLACFDRSDGCWLWKLKPAKNGYGYFSVQVDGKQRKVLAHRYSYEFFVGPIPDGLTLDHLCTVPLCVRPDHLDPCSLGDNVARSPRSLTGQNSRKTHCPQGHPYSGDNLLMDQGKRKCRTCVYARNRARSRAA
jgi:hypothetical protein